MLLSPDIAGCNHCSNSVLCLGVCLTCNPVTSWNIFLGPFWRCPEGFCCWRGGFPYVSHRQIRPFLPWLFPSTSFCPRELCTCETSSCWVSYSIPSIDSFMLGCEIKLKPIWMFLLCNNTNYFFSSGEIWKSTWCSWVEQLIVYVTVI